MLYGLILVVHIVVCFVLIAVILFQAGRGGGLSDAFSGGTAQAIFGTRGAEYLTKATTICATLFMITSISLAVLSARRGRSLMTSAPAAAVPAQAAPAQAESAPVPSPQPTPDEQPAPATQATGSPAAT